MRRARCRGGPAVRLAAAAGRQSACRDCRQCRRLFYEASFCVGADVDYFFQGNAADFAANPLAMLVPGTYLEFPTEWQHFVGEIPPEDRGDVVKELAKAFAVPPQNDADRQRLLKAASACVAWESSTSRLNLHEKSQSQPNQKYALTAARILIHYMINGGFLGATGKANRDTNYILDHVDRLRDFPVHIVHGRYDGCVIYTRWRPW